MKKVDSNAVIRFQSANPYEARFPNRKVVPREVIDLMKTLRTKGYKVVVEPDDERPLHYIVVKGFVDALTDPIYALLTNIAVTIFCSILTPWVSQVIQRGLRKNQIKVIVECSENGKKVYYDKKGKRLAEKKVETILNSYAKRASEYKETVDTKSPYEHLPVPLYLEHTNKIIGWGRVVIDDIGIAGEEIKIFDTDTLDRIDRGELKGFSIAGLVRSSECGICNKEYMECNHIAGRSYKKKICTNKIKAIDVAEFSIVASPVNPLAVITSGQKAK